MNMATLETAVVAVIGGIFGFLLKSVLTMKSLREFAAEQAAVNARVETMLEDVLRRLDRLEAA